jgi:uncharacterized protein
MIVLITGGSGLIGRGLTNELLRAGHEVRWLSRSGNSADGVRSFRWDPENASLDGASLTSVTHIVHLAGAGIANRRWTRKYKKQLRNSRVLSAQLLGHALEKAGIVPECLVGASAAGYYGTSGAQTVFSENDPAGNDFLARLCADWESAYSRIPAKRKCVVRTAVVLGAEGGALQKMILPFRLGFGAALGSGRQPIPWIHLSDIVSAYMMLLTGDSLSGPFNAAAPHRVTNAEFSKALATACKRPFFMPNLPAALLRLLLGEMSVMLLEGQHLSNERISAAGLKYRYADLDAALASAVE